MAGSLFVGICGYLWIGPSAAWWHMRRLGDVLRCFGHSIREVGRCFEMFCRLQKMYSRSGFSSLMNAPETEINWKRAWQKT